LNRKYQLFLNLPYRTEAELIFLYPGGIASLFIKNLLGAGIGGSSMEAEVVDSISGKQIGAVLESAKGGRIPFTNLGDWSAAKSVMDGWAERFQKRLEEAK
jgi:hypothetical protein